MLKAIARVELTTMPFVCLEAASRTPHGMHTRMFSQARPHSATPPKSKHVGFLHILKATMCAYDHDFFQLSKFP